jgi:hypothetical protein
MPRQPRIASTTQAANEGKLSSKPIFFMAGSWGLGLPRR